jgi:hypothetical protein
MNESFNITSNLSHTETKNYYFNFNEIIRLTFQSQSFEIRNVLYRYTLRTLHNEELHGLYS